MPGSDPATVAVLCFGLLCCTVLPRILARPAVSSPSDSPRPHLDSAARWVLVSLLSTLLCVVGALLLVPWSAALAWIGPPGVFLGLSLVALISAGALYALARRSPSRGQRWP